MVSIVGPLKNFIVREYSTPTIKRGHRSGPNLRSGKSSAFFASCRSWMDLASYCEYQGLKITLGVQASGLFNA
jgi:hypothetical protein